MNTWPFTLQGSRICHPKICLFGIFVTLSQLFSKKQQMWEKFRKPSRSYPFIRSICRNSPFGSISLSLYLDEEGDQIQKSFSVEKAVTSIYITITLVYCAFPGNFPTDSPHAQHSCLQLKMVFKLRSSSILESYSLFQGLSCVYMLLNFCMIFSC